MLSIPFKAHHKLNGDSHTTKRHLQLVYVHLVNVYIVQNFGGLFQSFGGKTLVKL